MIPRATSEMTMRDLATHEDGLARALAPIERNEPTWQESIMAAYERAVHTPREEEFFRPWFEPLPPEFFHNTVTDDGEDLLEEELPVIDCEEIEPGVWAPTGTT